MSTQRPSGAAGGPRAPRHYAQRADEGDETWLEDAIEDYLALEVTQAQRQICRSVASNRRTLVITANGLGKSYILAAIAVMWLVVRFPAVSFATSGTEKKMRRTFCKPVENLHDNAVVDLPGTYKSRPERIEVDSEPEHFFEAASPKDADEIEGVHEAYTLGIIEEAEKPAVDAEVIDAMRSLVSDGQDRLVAIANPPKDDSNSIVPLIESDKWDVLTFSSFASHNVQVELGEVEGEKIDGLATLTKIRDDWEEYNDEPWPGAEKARRSHERDDLDERWYRRRLGVMPPASADAHRPWSVEKVREAATSSRKAPATPPNAIGVDIARSGGDRTAIAYLWLPEKAPNHELGYLTTRAFRVEDHNENERKIRQALEFASEATDVGIDALGEGSALADRLAQEYEQVERFDAGSEADDDETYQNTRVESHARLSNVLDVVEIGDEKLRKEAAAAGRTYEYEERLQKSGSVLALTPKDKLEQRLNRSPDHLDAATIAAWIRESDQTKEVPSTWAA